MVYGAEVVLPTKLQYGSPRVRAYQLDVTEEARKDTIDLLIESRMSPSQGQLDSNRQFDGTTHAGFIPELS
jgi:hypothetical protein